MRAVILFSFLLSLSTVTATAAEPTRAEFDEIIKQRCVTCHTQERIDAAIAKGDNWPEIREKMIRFGAVLTPREVEVMGVFWNESRNEKQ